jgi:hypothetical protein
VQSPLAGDKGKLVEAKKALKGSFCLLEKKVRDLQVAPTREIVALRAEFTQEDRVLRDELAKCDTSRQRKMRNFKSSKMIYALSWRRRLPL